MLDIFLLFLWKPSKTIDERGTEDEEQVGARVAHKSKTCQIKRFQCEPAEIKLTYETFPIKQRNLFKIQQNACDVLETSNIVDELNLKLM